MKTTEIGGRIIQMAMQTAMHNTQNLANTLRGHWGGAMRYEYNDANGQRAIAQFNAQLEFDQYDATGQKGRGREIDTATSMVIRNHKPSILHGKSTRLQAISMSLMMVLRRNIVSLCSIKQVTCRAILMQTALKVL